MDKKDNHLNLLKTNQSCPNIYIYIYINIHVQINFFFKKIAKQKKHVFTELKIEFKTLSSFEKKKKV